MLLIGYIVYIAGDGKVNFLDFLTIISDTKRFIQAVGERDRPCKVNETGHQLPAYASSGQEIMEQFEINRTSVSGVP